MGKKADRILDLENRLEATYTLIRSVANLLNVSGMEPHDIRDHNLHAWIAVFTQAVHRGAVTTSTAVVASAPRAPGSWETYDNEVDEEIDRMKSRDLVPRTPTESSAMVPTDNVSAPTLILEIAHAVGVDVSDEESAAHALGKILRALEGLKNPGDVAGETAKGDTLLDAVRHGRDAEHEARGNLRSAREALARIASAMQIPHWDPANPEAAILERVQHWDGLKHLIRRRIGTLTGYIERSPGRNDVTAETQKQELQWVLVQIIAPLPLAKFMGKMTAAVGATPTVMQAVESATAEDPRAWPRPVTATDFGVIHGTEVGAHFLWEVLRAAAAVDPVKTDLLNFLNLVVLPALRRLPSAG